MPLDNIQEAGKILCAIDTVIPLKPDFSGIANIKKNVSGLRTWESFLRIVL